MDLAKRADTAFKFPRSCDRGLIEASMPPTVSAAESKFPRSCDRGLIEAITCFDWPRHPCHFRDHVIAASLKLCYCRHERIDPYHFRDHVIAASLKREVARTTGGEVSNFRDH